MWGKNLVVLVCPPAGEVGDLRPDELHIGKLLQFHHHRGQDLDCAANQNFNKYLCFNGVENPRRFAGYGTPYSIRIPRDLEPKIRNFDNPQR